MMQETPENIKWRELLRSGEYPQGRHQLFSPRQGYCCLGVARVGVFGGLCLHDVGLLDDEVEALGLTVGDEGRCMGMNDVELLSFEEIADVLDYAIEHGVSVAHAFNQRELPSVEVGS